MLEIIEVKTKKQLKNFVHFPLKLYKGNTFFVPPITPDEIKTLRRDKNPSFQFCEAMYWLAIKDSEIVGRIAGIINHKSNEIWNQKYARFGWFDFIDDYSVSKHLINAVENWAGTQGMTHIHGPMGFCDLDREGMLVEGFDEVSMINTYYNYAYYNKHMAELGFLKDVDWIEFQKTNLDFPVELRRMISLAGKKRLSNFTSVNIREKQDILMYKKGIINIINLSYEKLYAFTPINEEIFDFHFNDLLRFTNLDFIAVILDECEEVVGFGLAMPLLSEALKKSDGKLFPFGLLRMLKALRKNDSAALLLIAVNPDLQSKGIPLMILDRINSNFLKHNIKTIEVAHQLESNTNVHNLWKHFKPRQNKRRRCYIKNVE